MSRVNIACNDSWLVNFLLDSCCPSSNRMHLPMAQRLLQQFHLLMVALTLDLVLIRLVVMMVSAGRLSVFVVKEHLWLVVGVDVPSILLWKEVLIGARVRMRADIFWSSGIKSCVRSLCMLLHVNQRSSLLLCTYTMWVCSLCDCCDVAWFSLLMVASYHLLRCNILDNFDHWVLGHLFAMLEFDSNRVLRLAWPSYTSCIDIAGLHLRWANWAASRAIPCRLLDRVELVVRAKVLHVVRVCLILLIRLLLLLYLRL